MQSPILTVNVKNTKGAFTPIISQPATEVLSGYPQSM